MKRTRRIKTVLYGDQKFSAAELELLHTPIFQRLYDLHQLGLTDRVFVDASHSRFHHVLGAAEQASKVMESLKRNLFSKDIKELKYTDNPTPVSTTLDFAKLVTERVAVARLMALLHDLTHAPYGHTLEDEIRLVKEKHDNPQRQADAFYCLLVQFFGWLDRNSECAEADTLRAMAPASAGRLDNYFNAAHYSDPPSDSNFIRYLSNLAAILIKTSDARRKKQPFVSLGTEDLITLIKHLHFSMSALLYLEAAHKRAGLDPEYVPKEESASDDYPFRLLLNSLLQNLETSLKSTERFVCRRDAFMLDVIGNTICADLLDYAKRDALNAGLKLDYDSDRIVENFTLVSHTAPEASVTNSAAAAISHPFDKTSVRTAISLFSHKLRTDVPGELLNLLQVRFYVYERMLYHPTKCIAGAMLGCAIQLIGWRSLPRHFRSAGDAVFLRDISEAARITLGFVRSIQSSHAYLSKELVDSLKSEMASQVPTSVTEAMQHLLTDRLTTVADIKRNLKVSRLLAANKPTCELILKSISDASLSEDALFNASALSELEKSMTEEQAQASEQFLAPMLPQLNKIADEIEAGIRLLNRISARQYHKTVFRFLRHVGEETTFNAEHIANKFKDSTTRFVAERAIERCAGLPSGAISIHCPKSDGPAKMADILITAEMEGDTAIHPRRLNEVGKLLEPTFVKHQAAIRALEEMYASMWRLVVSVDPRYLSQWEKISEVATDVLNQIVAGGDNASGKCKRDDFLVREIQFSLRAGGSHHKEDQVHVLFPNGKEDVLPARHWEFLNDLGKLVESHPEIRAIGNAQPTQVQLLAKVRSIFDNQTSQDTALAKPQMEVFPRSKADIQKWLETECRSMKENVKRRVLLEERSEVTEVIFEAVAFLDIHGNGDAVFHDLRVRLLNESEIMWNDARANRIASLLRRKWQLSENERRN